MKTLQAFMMIFQLLVNKELIVHLSSTTNEMLVKQSILSR